MRRSRRVHERRLDHVEATISATQSTLQSVSAYLTGIPGISAIGMGGGVATRGGGPGGGFARIFGGGFEGSRTAWRLLDSGARMPA